MLRVIKNHKRAAFGKDSGYDKLNVNPVPLDVDNCPNSSLIAVEATPERAWIKCNFCHTRYRSGYRNW